MKPEEAIKRIENLIKGREDSRGKTELDFALDMSIEALKEQRPHGEWLPIDEMGSVVRCSRCSFRTCADVAEEEYNFCPNCGASMKEGEAE